MVNAILGTGAIFGVCYGIVFVVFLVIGLIKCGYEDEGFWGAFKGFLFCMFTGVLIISAIICIICTAFAICCAPLIFADKQFIYSVIGFGFGAIVSVIMGFISFKVMKATDVGCKKDEEEDLTFITEKEEEEIKDLVGGWYYWDRMDNKTKNEYIYEYRTTGTIKIAR